MPQRSKSSVLFIDAYDSFTNNVVSLLETTIDVEVTVIKIDTPLPDFGRFVEGFAAVIAGPGPGDPRNAGDVGYFQQLWNLDKSQLRPVLGICLGFQHLVHAHGGSIHRLPQPRHGLIRSVQPSNTSIFEDIGPFDTVQYHSLYACTDTGDDTPVSQPGNSNICSDLESLAWDYQKAHAASSHDTYGQKNPTAILMAVQHRQKPFYGVQFHPESICSSAPARKVVANWWKSVCRWWRNDASSTIKPGLFDTAILKATNNVRSPLQPIDPNSSKMRKLSNGGGNRPHVNRRVASATASEKPNETAFVSNISRRVKSRIMDKAQLNVPLICDLMDLAKDQFVLLDSEQHTNTEVGRFSIIGLVEKRSTSLEYSVLDSKLWRTVNGIVFDVDLKPFADDPFNYFDFFIDCNRAKDGQPHVPFWGGLMGFVTYEACLSCLERTSQVNESSFRQSSTETVERPDLAFVFVERSIVVDHIAQKIYLQTISADDDEWLDQAVSSLSSNASFGTTSAELRPGAVSLGADVSLPSETQYKAKIRKCKELIGAGESYEICLTVPASVSIPKHLDSWLLYRRLRKVNPAPFGAYVRLGRLSLLSSSPERFMKWSRPQKRPGRDRALYGEDISECTLQYRPIKGTVPRQHKSSSVPLTLDQATRILATPKERAENLMIVDLIRHDLHGTVGSGRVTVPKLMVVEEYETVFQLVSVIEGRMQLHSSSLLSRASRILDSKSHEVIAAKPKEHELDAKDECCRTDHHNDRHSKTASWTPIQALAATLPPGSMTGAPKLRSCQILAALEARPRGVYSGVVGYMDVGGGGDWSVSIRGAVRWDNQQSSNQAYHTTQESTVPGARPARECANSCSFKGDSDVWTIGAGGAVTALSTEEGEWNEMMSKMQATLRLFE